MAISPVLGKLTHMCAATFLDLWCTFVYFICQQSNNMLHNLLFLRLGKLSYKKNDEKRGLCPLWAPPPPKRVKRGHLSSDYRQKNVNATRDILMTKERKITIFGDELLLFVTT